MVKGIYVDTKSSSFSEAEKHYHSTFKEILAVKRGIEKFKFHLIGHHFFIEMDMSAFPKMLNFKQKQILNSQLLRWAEWFSNFDFKVKHIKSHNNLLPDLLSRSKPKFPVNKTIPISYMMRPSSSTHSYSRPPEVYPNMDNFPPEIHNLIANKTLKAQSKELILKYQSIVIQNRGIHILGGLGFHRDYPFLNLFSFDPNRLQWEFSKEILCFLWYLLELHQIAFCFNTEAMATWLPQLDYDLWKTYPELYPELNYNAKNFFEWFHPINHWMKKFHIYMGKFKDIRTSIRNVHVIIIFDRQCYFKDIGHYTHFYHIRDYTVLPFDLHKDWKTYLKEFRTFQRKMAEINQTIPPEIWPNIDDDTPWECLPMPYAKRLQEDIEIHMKKSYPHTPLTSSPQESATTSQQVLTITPHQLEATQSMMNEYPHISSVPNPNNFDPDDPDNLEKLEEQLWEDQHKLENMPWWKQQGLPSDSDDSDSPALAANFGTP
ncbi:RNA-directed DNA polymerase [Abeliophyllum distichum]|uniref:RNA-directed DNA polymerase n=1 Tax=Abeliophyllum distichum TaxID=126358 RepID=A0ABD1SFS0_9LAMI